MPLSSVNLIIQFLAVLTPRERYQLLNRLPPHLLEKVADLWDLKRRAIASQDDAVIQQALKIEEDMLNQTITALEGDEI